MGRYRALAAVTVLSAMCAASIVPAPTGPTSLASTLALVGYYHAVMLFIYSPHDVRGCSANRRDMKDKAVFSIDAAYSVDYFTAPLISSASFDHIWLFYSLGLFIRTS